MPFDFTSWMEQLIVGIANPTSSIYTHPLPSLLLGVPFIDKGREELVTQLDKLIGNKDAVIDPESFSETVSQLGRKINEHISHEEQLFKSLGMPKPLVLSHFEAHTEILEHYTLLNLDLMAGKEQNYVEVFLMIKEWFVRHIVSHDLIIKKYLPA
ncbi:MAG: hemerythrin family protein [Betaproteobacteria bacterium]